MPATIHDALIIGGGPAGLSAAIYLARFLRDTVVIDAGDGRSSGPQRTENYLGFPRGVRAVHLRDLGRRQAERFGARIVAGRVSGATAQHGLYHLDGEGGPWRGRTVIIATGVTDVWPAFAGVERYIGRSLFWCITCDGFRTLGRRVALVGATDEAVSTACQFLQYTDDVTFIAVPTGGEAGIGPDKRRQLLDQGIAVVDGAIERAVGARGQLRRVVVNGVPLEVDLLFSLLGQTPNTELAARLGVLLDDAGYIRIDREQRTNVPCLYAAGDVTGPYAHQISTAVHEGAMAAQAANYDLYPAFQRE
ncbi:MAG: NAD(P)/FAD-dependent oxidoreductase [Dehalococcoidia bacterium]